MKRSTDPNSIDPNSIDPISSNPNSIDPNSTDPISSNPDDVDTENEKGLLDGITVLSLEQAVALPYGTWRLALEGARVIRIEPLWGDPNRKVGPSVPGAQWLTGYFISTNTNKESITLDLNRSRGRELLGELISKLDVDVFACNQIPKNYAKLGIDHQRLSAIKPDLIWVGVSGFGPGRSEPAYDPMIQAYSGVSATNGEPDTPPQKFGVSIADLECANQVFTETIKALWQRDRTGKGARVDVTLLESCLSLLALHIGMESLGHHQEKAGNGHPIFAPVGVFPTLDGHICLAVGNDAQWQAFVKIPAFREFDRPEFVTNNLRQAGRRKLEADIGICFFAHGTDQLMDRLTASKVPAAPVHTIAQTLTIDDLSKRLLRLHDDRTGLEMALAPPPVLPTVMPELTLPPKLGEQNEKIYGRLGYDIAELREQGLVS